MSHNCTWRLVEKRRDNDGRWWHRDQCLHGLNGGWFLPDLTIDVCPWRDIEPLDSDDE